ncbi:MAG: EamA family transporter [Eubacteriales bacterium]|nr:EamA family transporter [Eubacteriales bacterium]
MNTKATLKDYVLLHMGILVLALGTVSAKHAASFDMLSLPFVLFYGLDLLALGIYAIVWQQVLKHVPLSTAFYNKSVTIVWGLFTGAIFFGEAITLTKVLGAVIVIAGVILVVSADE